MPEYFGAWEVWAVPPHLSSCQHNPTNPNEPQFHQVGKGVLAEFGAVNSPFFAEKELRRTHLTIIAGETLALLSKGVALINFGKA